MRNHMDLNVLEENQRYPRGELIQRAGRWSAHFIRRNVTKPARKKILDSCSAPMLGFLAGRRR